MQSPATKQLPAIITIAYQSEFALKKLAAEFFKQQLRPTCWLIVDNSPVSAPFLQIDTPFFTHILAGKEGDGFGAGCNRGLDWLASQGWSDWVWLLNPDITFSNPKLLGNLADKVRSFPVDAVIGTAVTDPYGIFEANGGWIQTGLNYRSSLLDPKSLNNPEDQLIEVDWVSGCSLLLNPGKQNPPLRFDPLLPLYFEDIDFCLRAKQQKIRCLWSSSIKLTHQRGCGSQGSAKRREKLKLISNIRFLQRYQSAWVVYFHTIRIITLAICKAPCQPQRSMGALLGVIHAWIRPLHSS